MHGAKIVEGVRVTGFRMDGRRITAVETDPRRHRLRQGRELRAASGRGRSARWRASTCRCSRSSTSTSSPKRSPGLSTDAPTHPRPRPAHLFQGGGRRAGHGRLRAEPAGLDHAATCRTTGNSGCSTTTTTISTSTWSRPSPASPRWQTAGVKQMINGAESFTPDGNFILGRAPECANMFVGAGFNAFGIAERRRRGLGAGAMGRCGARRRSTSGSSTSAASRACTATATGWRERTLRSLWQALHRRLPARGIRERPPAHRLAALRPAEGAPRGVRLEARLGAAELVRARRDGAARRLFDGPAELVRPGGRGTRACAREAVGVFDQSSFAKYELTGRDAERGAGPGSAPTDVARSLWAG